MNPEELKNMINIEFTYIDITVSEITDLYKEIAENIPKRKEKAAIAQFISEFYNGTENILKRICKYCNIVIPSGGQSHTELFQYFCNPSFSHLPVLFDDLIVNEYRNIRKFRHYIIHGYAFNIEWDLIKESLAQIKANYSHFKSNVNNFLDSIE
jgi:hypothetical protein